MKKSYVVLITAHGTLLLKISCVIGHIYLACLTIRDFLSSGSFTSVNFTGIRSFIFNGFPLRGQYIVLSGFCNVVSFASGVLDGIQKLGNILSLPLLILETEEPDSLAVIWLRETIFFSPFKNFCNFCSSSLALFSLDCSLKNYKHWLQNIQ